MLGDDDTHEVGSCRILVFELGFGSSLAGEKVLLATVTSLRELLCSFGGLDIFGGLLAGLDRLPPTPVWRGILVKSCTW